LLGAGRYQYFHHPVFRISSFTMPIIASIDDLESELSDTLNTTAFDTATHATASDLADAETGGDLVEIGGKPTSQSIAQPIIV